MGKNLFSCDKTVKSRAFGKKADGGGNDNVYHTKIGNFTFTLFVDIAVELSDPYDFVKIDLTVGSGSHNVGNDPELGVQLFNAITVVSVAEAAFALWLFCK